MQELHDMTEATVRARHAAAQQTVQQTVQQTEEAKQQLSITLALAPGYST